MRIGALICSVGALIAFVAASTSAATTPPRVLEIRGFWHEMYGVDRAVARAGGAVMTQTWPGKNTISWYSPASPDDLSRYRLVVVDNVAAGQLADTNSLTAVALKSYVDAGGSVLILGGRYGCTPDYHGTPLEEISPVDYSATTDRVAGPFNVAVEQGAPAYSFAQKPVVLWMHNVVPKTGARVVLSAGGKPLLIEGEYGKGRVAVFAGTVMGDPDSGQTPFWAWDEWPRVLGDTVSWLMASQSASEADPISAMTAALAKSAGQQPGELAALMQAADDCRDTSAANRILDQLVKLSWDLPVPDADRLDVRLRPYIDTGSADVATRLTGAGDIGRISLGLRLLGQSHAPAALATLTGALRTGEVSTAATGADDLTPDTGEVADPTDRSNAIMVAATIGLGRLCDPAAQSAIQAAIAASQTTVTPAGNFPTAPTFGDQMAHQGSIALLRCGDSSAAMGAVAGIIAVRTTLASTMLEMSIPLVGRGTHETELLHRLNARRAYAAASAANADTQTSLIGVPDTVLPALATTLAQTDDDWAIPIAYTVFGRSFRPALSPDVATILKTAKLPAIAELAAR